MAFNLQQALERIRGQGPLLILTHDNPDPDALASALGLQTVIASVGVESTLGFGGIIGRAENRAMVRELGINLTPIELLDPAQFPLLALVDTQPNTGNNSFFPQRKCDILIDHHPAMPSSPEVPWCDIREDLAASMMIVYHYLRELKIPLTPQLATAFIYALKSETRDLGREAGQEERVAYVDIFPLVDHAKLHAILSPKLGLEHFAAVERALRNAEFFDGLLTANLGELAYPDLVAEVADILLPYDRANWVMCVGQHNGIVYLSVRTDLVNAHAGALIRRVLDRSGAGGGHGMMAGGRLFAPVRDEKQLRLVYAGLVDRLAKELGIDALPKPLLG